MEDIFEYQKKLKTKIRAINARIAKGEEIYFDVVTGDRRFVRNVEYTEEWGGEAYINTIDGKRFNMGSMIFNLF